MYSLADFEEYKGQEINNKSILAWSKRIGYFFLTYHSFLLAMSECGDFKVIGVEK